MFVLTDLHHSIVLTYLWKILKLEMKLIVKYLIAESAIKTIQILMFL